MTARDVWDGRPVIFAEFSIREGRPVTQAFQRDGEQGSFALLVASMRWADSGEPVFADIDAIEVQPFRLRPTLARLSAKAAFVNGLRADDPDDEADAAPVAGNGHDAEVAARPSS
jgi:hypothetical protein